MAQYTYQSLETEGTIRILTLEPGRANETLTGALEEVPLDCAEGYEALSYVWMDPELPDLEYNIAIHEDNDYAGLLRLRGGSIFAALHQLRLTDRPRRIWADQCCINQDNLEERSHQVQYMNRIYRDASHVLVWLGMDVKKEASLAFALIRVLNEVLKSGPKDDTCHSRSSEIERHIKENQKEIRALTDRMWFKRGWILQEIGTGTTATLLWGNAVIGWDVLASVCERLKSYHLLRSTLGIRTSDISFLYRRFIEPNVKSHHVNRFNFVYELQRARHLQFTDNRDRIFAFLGHYSVRTRGPLGCGPVKIVADYTKTVEQTYIDAAMKILQVDPSATCIVLGSVQHRTRSLPSRDEHTHTSEISLKDWLKNEERLPSWVPDWSWSEGILLAEPICPHHAHGKTTARIEFLHDDHLRLLVHGVEIDTIRVPSQLLQSNDFYLTRKLDQSTTTLQKLWSQTCGGRIFNLSDRYQDGGSALFAFMQTLSNGCVQAAGHQGDRYHEISEHVWLREAARYILQTQESSKVANEVKFVADDISREIEPENWSRWASSASHGRTFTKTERGYYVLGPAALEEGDIVCVLFGCKVPFCLRRIGTRYLLVGECYVHGLMKGEAVDMMSGNGLQETAFEIY